MDIYGDFHGYMGIGYKCKCIQCPLHVVYLVFCSYQRFEILIRSLVQLNYSRLNAKRNDSADRSVACQAVVLSSTLLLQKHILTKLWQSQYKSTKNRDFVLLLLLMHPVCAINQCIRSGCSNKWLKTEKREKEEENQLKIHTTTAGVVAIAKETSLPFCSGLN